MEDEKKMKRSKKKKNKQATKHAKTVTLDSKESTLDNRSHALETVQDKNGQCSGDMDVTDGIGVSTDTDRDGPIANGTEDAHLANSEKQHWLDRETENNVNIQKEDILERKIKQLLKEKDANLQKQASQEENINQLNAEKLALIKKDNLEEKIKQLIKEKDAYLQNEHFQAGLEMKILQLENEKGSWLQKEIGLEMKINQLIDQTADLNLTVVSLQEKIKLMERERDSWILNENSSKELIASLNDDNSKLQAQVTALEQSRKSLLEERQQLTENISSLQSQISRLEKAVGSPSTSVEDKMTSHNGDVNYHVEAARTLIDKLISENAELVEKVNELYAELDRRALRTEDSASLGSGPGTITAQPTEGINLSTFAHAMAIAADDRSGTAQAADSTLEAGKTMPVSVSNQSLEDIIIEDERNSEKDVAGFGNASEIVEADEIVHISLGGNEDQETNTENDENSDVPLTDAPLIGAPFRLISFVARYVSGADLIDKNTRNSG